MKRPLAILLIVSIALSLVPCAALADGSGEYLESGLYSAEKLSKEEIADLIYFSPVTMPEEIFAAEPSVTAPYAAGEVSADTLGRTINRLNMFRTIAGLGEASLDPELCRSAQYGAVLLAASNFSHYPDQPEDMDDGFYELAAAATSECNIFAGRDLPFTPDAFIEDSNAANISALGHRRWQLNPALGSAGFGYAENPDSVYRKYTCENVFDTSAEYGDYDFIGWPSSGNFPNNLTAAFGINTAWSVSLNPLRYRIPVLSELTVTVTRESDGLSVTLSGTDAYSPTGGAYLNVDTNGYGVANCIIFRPVGFDGYNGLFTVSIDGVRNTRGEAVDFAYRVDFFKAALNRVGPNEALNAEDGDIEFFTGRDHPFTAAEYGDRLVGVSGNSGADGSVSFVTVELVLNDGDKLSFDYRYSTEEDGDLFVFTVNGSEELRLSGESDGWQTHTFTASGHGSFVFKWSFVKDGEGAGGEDLIMLDEILLSRAPVLMGDVDFDGAVTSFDALIVLRYALGLLHGLPGYDRADMDGSGAVDSFDALVILRLSMGIGV